ncbi:diguanylate cyclase [Gallaecimonas pentaromativorans]|uniref:sensor domain-containing diguanylate cyclase n=1 Tax=Gallaecimonas pentaromativorans TaxID=584787 RepID=UPI003A8DA454
MLKRHQPLANIRVKTLWLFCGVLFVVFFLMSWSSYRVAQRSISQQIEHNSLPLTSDNVYSQIQRDLVQPTFVATLMAHDTFVRDWAMQATPSATPMQRYLAEIDQRFDTIIAFFVRDADRRLYLPDAADHIIDATSHRYDWYEKVKALPENKPYLVTVGMDPERQGQMDIFIDHKVYDYQHRFIGVTGVGLSVEQVHQLLARYEQRYQRRIYFVDRQGKVVLSGQRFEGEDSLQAMPGMATIAAQLLSAPSGSYHFESGGHKTYVNARLVPEFDWYLVVEEHQAASLQAVFKTFLINVAIAGLITLMVLGISLATQGRYQRKLAAQASVDPLTLALNRRSGQELHRLMLDECNQQNQPLSVLVLDVDHFKQVNDQYGHEAGDTVLKDMVQEIKQHVRESDAICRWGGEEFLVLLNGCDLTQALSLAERIRTGMSAHRFTFKGQAFYITLSGGVAQNGPKEPLEEVVKRADAALYLAKENGRNQIQTGAA